MDIREIELDVHYYFSMSGWPWEWKRRLLLSHGTDDHTGISAFDRDLGEGLAEVRNWLENESRPGDLLIIDIEDHIDGHYDMAVEVIEEYLGPWVYRPSGSAALPLNVSRNDIIASGKKVLFFSSGGNDALWRSWVHTREGLKQSKPDGFSADPSVGGSFTPWDYENYIIRIYEDRTNLSAMFSDPGSPLTQDLVYDMVRTGVNFVSMDKLKPFDGRLEAAVWSWDVNQPDGSGDDCAVHKENGRFDDIPCSALYRFACKNDAGVWYITGAAGSWAEGQYLCESEGGAGFSFALPATGSDNEALKAEKLASGVSRVWIRYGSRVMLPGPETDGPGDAVDSSDMLSDKGSVMTGCASEASAGQRGNSHSGGGILSLILFLLVPSVIVYMGKKIIRAS